MLGLGNTTASSGYTFADDNDISNGILNHSLSLLKSDQPDTGSITDTISPTTTFGDIRLFSAASDFVSPVTDYKLTSLTVENTTAGVGPVELLSADLQFDQQANFVSVFYYSTNDDTIIDNLDFGSSSAYTWKHTGTGANSFTFVGTITHEQFDGELTLTTTLGLNDSDEA